MNGLNFIELKGDVTFYSNANGSLFQQLGADKIFKVKDGKITYRIINIKFGFIIKYQNNGTNGFSIFKGKRLLEDNIWTYAEAERIAKSMKPW